MKMKTMFAIPVLAFAMAGSALAASYFSVSDTVDAAGTKLKAGQYEISPKNDQARITDSNGKSFTLPVKVEQAATKFSNTQATTKTVNGDDELIEVDLGGSTTRLLFSNAAK